MAPRECEFSHRSTLRDQKQLTLNLLEQQPTKLVTASDDDHSPVILLWDLRNWKEPERVSTFMFPAFGRIRLTYFAFLQVLRGHEKGILSVAWCKDDSDLIISSGKDGRTIAWGASTGEIVAEVSTLIVACILRLEFSLCFIMIRWLLHRIGLSTPRSVLAILPSSAPPLSTEPFPSTLSNRPTLLLPIPLPLNLLPHRPTRILSTLPRYSSKRFQQTPQTTQRNLSLSPRNG